MYFASVTVACCSINKRPIAHTVPLYCPNTFRILMERNCVLCDVGTSVLYALHTEVSYSHEAVPTLTPKFQTFPHNSALQTQHAAQTVRTPAVRIPPPCHRFALTRRTSGHCLQTFSSTNPPTLTLTPTPVCACDYRH
jgi:hypothetical protein